MDINIKTADCRADKKFPLKRNAMLSKSASKFKTGIVGLKFTRGNYVHAYTSTCGKSTPLVLIYDNSTVDYEWPKYVLFVFLPSLKVGNLHTSFVLKWEFICETVAYRLTAVSNRDAQQTKVYSDLRFTDSPINNVNTNVK